jgi:RNA polymerase sigma factor (TIGR02999 family)
MVMESSQEQVTQLLKDWGNGDQTALDKLLPMVYDELHRMARQYMARQNSGQTLQTTALINEAYLRLAGRQEKQWQNRAHFYGVAAQAMRCILVDRARARHAGKRGGWAQEVPLEEADAVSDRRVAELIALDDALKELARIDPRKCRIVELRYFGGLSVEETAEVLHVSPATVKRDWGLAKAWLHHALSKGGGK